MRNETKGSIIILTIMIAGMVALSFLVTTYVIMILGGMVGHFTSSKWLMQLGFWQYAPVWVMVLILKVIF